MSSDENPDILEESTYMNLMPVRERFSHRRSAVKRGEVLYAPDMSYTFAHFGVLPVLYAEYADGKVFEVVAEGSKCSESPNNEHTMSSMTDGRKRWCVYCHRTVYDYRSDEE
jgi:hypothetical protein